MNQTENREVVAELGTIGRLRNGRYKTLQLISYDGHNPCFDFRVFKIQPDGTEQIGAGISFSHDEAIDLMQSLEMYFNEVPN